MPSSSAACGRRTLPALCARNVLCWGSGEMAPPFRPVTVAIISFLVLTGCAARRQLVAPPPPQSSVLPHAAAADHGGQAAERVKDAIKSLGHELRKRSGKSPRALAELEAIPLISASSPVRAVGTSGMWAVVEATHDPLAKREAFSQTQTRSAEPRPPDRQNPTPWVLVGVAAAVLLGAIAARWLSTRPRIEHS
jgi:hypothetical protein